ncbi:FAD-dependent oxidoreductase [Actinomadura sp. 9N407]|uniref:FAD-dependent oxidoreductase n=1 Tax=Actinomadura sp. 9N407 TaxID=3375154 RepID=UPI0037B6F40D
MPLHVIIIGAGTGGMCLAQGLLRAGISVAVYERDRTRSDGLYGYRIGIDPTGNKALKESLPPELFDTFVATCARAPRYLNVLTERLRSVASFPLRPDDDELDSERSVSRMTLRQVLLTGLEDVVRFDKTFTHYETKADGTVTAYFEDGTSATGDVLVAADGTGSRVRRQYLPHAEVTDSGIISVAAKVPLVPETRKLLRPEVLNGISMLFAPKGAFCILHVMEFKWDRDATVKEGIGETDAGLIAKWPGLLYDNTRDYINWGFSMPRERLPSDVLRMEGEALKDLVLAKTPGWHPDLRRLFALADPSSCVPIELRSSKPVAPWVTTTVTLLGDAIHTMTPGRGVGGNTALRDAALLRRALVSAHNGDRGLLDALADYETEMIRYGFERVADSLKQNGTSADDPMFKPYTGRAMLAVTRAFFRLTARVPAMRRKFIDDLYTYRGADDPAF